MARKGGLGPQGRAAIERASRELAKSSRAPVTTVPNADTSLGNPAVTDTVANEKETMPPYEDWWAPVKPSTRVANAAYDAPTHRLYMLFVDGTPWTYENVSTQEWVGLQRTDSPGRYVNDVLNSKNYHHGQWL